MKSSQCNDGKYYIICNLCVGCGICLNVCPVNAISSIGSCYQIESSKCVCCGARADTCPVAAVMISIF